MHSGKPLPVYGDGGNVRDWLYVTDHCMALRAVLERGRIGETYNIGGNVEKANLEVVGTVCAILDELLPAGAPHKKLLEFVVDRPGHDRRYALDSGKLCNELGRRPTENFDSGIAKTVAWYLDNPKWVAGVMGGEYKKWIDTNYRAKTTQ